MPQLLTQLWHNSLQNYLNISRSLIPEVLSEDIPELARDREVWCIFWEVKLWRTSYMYLCRSHASSNHYDDVIMTMLASQITSLPVVCSIVYSDVNQRKHQSSASLAFVREIHRGPVNFPHKWPVTRKMFPFDDVIMTILFWTAIENLKHNRCIINTSIQIF